MNNNVVLIGKVSKGFELKEITHTDGASTHKHQMGSFTIALGTGKEESGKEILAYYQVETWNKKQQEFLRDQLKKGDLVAVKGNLDIQEFETESGSKNRAFKVLNPKVQLLGNSSTKNNMTSIAAVGRLTHDVELSKTNNGNMVAQFSVAVNDPMSRDSKAQFLNIECWNDQAENMAKYLSKGSLVSISGELTNEVYMTKDGAHIQAIKIVGPEINFLGKRHEGRQDNFETQDKKATNASINKEDDRLPF